VVERSAHGITCAELETDEIGDGQDVIAAGAPPAEANLAAHAVAVAAATFCHEAFLAG
jgi:hypothetical protein